MTTGTPDKRESNAMERAAIMVGRRALSDPICMKAIRKLFARKISLPALYVAYNFGTIAELVEDSLLLVDAIQEYRATVKNRQIIIGLNHLQRLAPTGVDMSWL